MEYMEQQMQQQIEAGLSNAEQCYARITELEDQNAAMAAQLHVLKTAAKFILNSKRRLAKRKAYAALADAVNKTPQQHCAGIKIDAVKSFVAELVKSVNPMSRPFLEGVCDAVTDRFKAAMRQEGE